MRNLAEAHLKSILKEKCSVKFQETKNFVYLMVSAFPVLERNFKFDAKLSYNCGHGIQETLCKNFEVEIILGELKKGLTKPSLRLISNPDICKPLEILQLFGIF